MNRLITIPPSHYCEKARWALDRTAIPYVEEPHVPLFHFLSTKRLGGNSTPIFVHEGGVLRDSTDILRWVDTQLPEDRRLFSSDQAATLEEAWDQRLGPDVRLYAYTWLLDRPEPFVRCLSTGAPAWQRRVFSVTHPAVARAIRTGLKITPERGVRALARINEAFDAVDALLSDGRPYLCGDRFSAADLTFASLMVPLLAPEGSRAVMIRRDEMPDGLRPIVDALAARPAGQHVLRLFRDDR